MANLPGGGGIGMGAARGSITIQHNFNQVLAGARSFASNVNTVLGTVNRGAQQASQAFTRLNTAVNTVGRGFNAAGFARGAAGGAVGGAFGGPLGAVAGGALAGGTFAPAAVGLAAVQLGRFAVAASDAATAYDRQRVAAVNLAGSQSQLNELMAAYEQASGGAVDEATALSNVTRLMAVGFADDAEEVDRFTRAVRGSSIAMGRLQDEISQEVQLAISNQSLRRLDQIGLGITEVNQRITELRANNEGMSREAAFQEAVLSLLIEKFGALADSAEGQATGVEKLRKEWRDMRLEVGKEIKPNINQASSDLADFIGWIRRTRSEWAELARQMQIGQLIQSGRGDAVRVPAGTSRTGQRLAAGLPAQRRMAAPSRFDDDQTAAIVEWSQARAGIEDTANQARLDATEQYESQRTSAIRRFEQTIAREAEDFARQRARAETQFQKDIADVQEDGAKREAEITRNLGRREADIHEQLGKRQADIREQVNDRLLDIEESYQKARERATRDHRDNLMDAASRLDARAIFEEQRRFKRQQEDLLEARDEQVEQAQEGADEQLEQAREAADDQIQVARESAAEQLEVARRNTQDRLAEMRADFEDRKREEDIDRAIRLQRMAEDHDDQLTEMARQHSQRIQQIGEHAQQERDKLDEEFLRQLDELDVFIDGFEERQKRITNIAIKEYDKLFEHITRSLRTPPPPSTGGGRFGLPEIPEFQHGGFVPRDMLALLHKGERVLSANQVQAGAASIQIEAGAFQFHGMTGDPADLQLAVEGAFANILERIKGPM